MTERPILFSAPMVRAVLDGSKTQTRRAVRDQTVARRADDGVELWTGFLGWQAAEAVLADPSLNGNRGAVCPFGVPGDRLWVREAVRFPAEWDGLLPRDLHAETPVWREADGPAPAAFGKLRPSLHMPKDFSRILLEVQAVRVERLQSISADDCYAEGIPAREVLTLAPFDDFRALWESTGGDWSANPWVWAVSFRRVRP